ncbi:hypothetical protein HK102_013575 [Quaeritorhiza haematococci]|nr:hypothetical protein HK102_013575 [Quaeritorhiza haematococci]
MEVHQPGPTSARRSTVDSTTTPMDMSVFDGDIWGPDLDPFDTLMSKLGVGSSTKNPPTPPPRKDRIFRMSTAYGASDANTGGVGVGMGAAPPTSSTSSTGGFVNSTDILVAAYRGQCRVLRRIYRGWTPLSATSPPPPELVATPMIQCLLMPAAVALLADPTYAPALVLGGGGGFDLNGLGFSGVMGGFGGAVGGPDTWMSSGLHGFGFAGLDPLNALVIPALDDAAKVWPTAREYAGTLRRMGQLVKARLGWKGLGFGTGLLGQLGRISGASSSVGDAQSAGMPSTSASTAAASTGAIMENNPEWFKDQNLFKTRIEELSREATLMSRTALAGIAAATAAAVAKVDVRPSAALQQTPVATTNLGAGVAGLPNILGGNAATSNPGTGPQDVGLRNSVGGAGWGAQWMSGLDEFLRAPAVRQEFPVFMPSNHPLHSAPNAGLGDAALGFGGGIVAGGAGGAGSGGTGGFWDTFGKDWPHDSQWVGMGDELDAFAGLTTTTSTTSTAAPTTTTTVTSTTAPKPPTSSTVSAPTNSTTPLTNPTATTSAMTTTAGSASTSSSSSSSSSSALPNMNEQDIFDFDLAEIQMAINMSMGIEAGKGMDLGLGELDWDLRDESG